MSWGIIFLETSICQTSGAVAHSEVSHNLEVGVCFWGFSSETLNIQGDSTYCRRDNIKNKMCNMRIGPYVSAKSVTVSKIVNFLMQKNIAEYIFHTTFSKIHTWCDSITLKFKIWRMLKLLKAYLWWDWLIQIPTEFQILHTAQQNCRINYQKITMRGVLYGSATANMSCWMTTREISSI